MKNKPFCKAVIVLDRIAAYAQSYIPNSRITLMYKCCLPKQVFNCEDLHEAEKFFEAITRYSYPDNSEIIGFVWEYTKSRKSEKKNYFTFEVSVPEGTTIYDQIVSDCFDENGGTFVAISADGSSKSFKLVTVEEGVNDTQSEQTTHKGFATREEILSLFEDKKAINEALLSLYARHFISEPYFNGTNTISVALANMVELTGYDVPDEYISEEQPSGIIPLILKDSFIYEERVKTLNETDKAVFEEITRRFYACVVENEERRAMKPTELILKSPAPHKEMSVKELAAFFNRSEKYIRNVIRKNKISPSGQLKNAHLYFFRKVSEAIAKE